MPRKSLSARIFAASLSSLALCGGLVHAQAQQPAAPAAAPAPATAPPALRVGVIDMDKAFEGYKKAAFLREQIKQAIVEKNGELSRTMSSMRQLAKELEGLDPSSNDFKAKEGEITKLKVQYETEREQAQADFSRRDAEALATIYKDIQAMTARVAQAKGLTFVVKVTSEAPSGTDPNSVLAAMSHSIIFYDPSYDLTSFVVHNLNLEYERQGGATVAPAAAGATTAAPPADRAAVPASATAAPRTAAPAPGVRRTP
jgi:Skp family chaperone for outer membrane proteins